MERSIGEVFEDPEYGSLIVVEQNGCDGCVWCNKGCSMSSSKPLRGVCARSDRSDHRSVVFKKAPSKFPYKFKIGDVVKVVTGGAGCNPNDKGKTSTIVELGEYMGQPGYRISPGLTGNAENGSKGAYGGMAAERSFELVDTVLKVGDWVRIDNLRRSGGGTHNGTIGHVGKIVKTSSSDTFFELSPYCPGGSWEAHNLVKVSEPRTISTTVPEKESSRYSYKFKVGDYVKCVARGFGFNEDYLGRKYQITELGEYNSSPGYRVFPEEGNSLGSSYRGFNGERSFELWVEPLDIPDFKRGTDGFLSVQAAGRAKSTTLSEKDLTDPIFIDVKKI